MAHRLAAEWVGSEGWEAVVRPTAMAAGPQGEKADYSVVLVEQASYVDRSVVWAALVNCAARSWPKAGADSEESANGNESV